MPGAAIHGGAEQERVDALGDCARRTTALLGGGCVIRVFNPEVGGYVAKALDHLDGARREQLEATSRTDAPVVSGGWIGQALERRRTVRLADVDAALLRELGLPPDERIGEVMVVPIPALKAALIVTRDRVAGPFGGLHRGQVERIASRLDGGGASAPGAERSRSVPSFHGSDRFLDVCSATVWVVDPDGISTYLNQAASELVGQPADEVRGVPIHEFLGHAPSRARAGFYGAEAADRPLVRGDGTMRWVSVTSRPLSGRRGEHSGTLYTMVDVTERRGREVELRMRSQRQEALLELANLAADGTAAKDLMQRAVSTVAEQLEVELVSIGKVDADRGTGEAVAAVGWSQDVLRGDGGEPGTVVIPPASATLHAVRTEEPVIVLDYESPSAFERGPALERAGVRSAGLVPFADGTAALAAHSTRPEGLTADGIELMESIARLLERHWPPPSAAD